jgi:hypothetical protein
MGTGNWIDLGIFAGGGFLAAHVGNWLLGLRRRKIGPPRYEAREAPAPFEAFYAADWRGDGCYGEDGCGPTRFLASGHETARAGVELATLAEARAFRPSRPLREAMKRWHGTGVFVVLDGEGRRVNPGAGAAAAFAAALAADDGRAG